MIVPVRCVATIKCMAFSFVTYPAFFYFVKEYAERQQSRKKVSLKQAESCYYIKALLHHKKAQGEQKHFRCSNSEKLPQNIFLNTLYTHSV